MSAETNAVVLDTSSLMAVVNDESDMEQYATAIAKASSMYLSAVSRVELAIVAQNRGLDRQLHEMLEGLPMQIAPFDEVQSRLAITAFKQFGKGRHQAALNFGDCCAYALAKSLNLPLLFKGNDFAQTDITSALV